MDLGCGQESKTALAPRPSQGPHPAAMLESPWRSSAQPHLPGEMTFYLRSFWLRKPSFIFSTTLASIELASLAKSRSRISETGTETMAKASLSSLVGHVPSWEATGKQHHTVRAVPGMSLSSATNPGEVSDPVRPRWMDWGGLHVTGMGSRLVSSHPLGSSGYFSPWVKPGCWVGRSMLRAIGAQGTNPCTGAGSGASP